MISLSEVHFWTTQDDIVIKPTDYGSFRYYAKKETQESLYLRSKKQYCEERNKTWSPLNNRPAKLRERLKELEEYLVHNKIVSYGWEGNKLRLLLSTGLITSIYVNNKSGDIVNIVFDKQLSAKLQANIICDGTLFGAQVICICNDGHLLGYGGQWKEGWVIEGGPRRRLNYYGEWLAVWGKAGSEHPQPWSPLAKDHQRANLHLYWIGARDPEMLAYKKTDGEPLLVVVSKTIHRTLIVVEQKVTQRGTVSVEVSNLELFGTNLKRVSVTSVPLQTQVSCSVLSNSEDRLLIGCIDGSLALLDRIRGSTRTIKASFIPIFAIWHTAETVVAIANERGQLQYFDTALNCVSFQLIGEECIPQSVFDMSCYFNTPFSIASINWGPENLLISLEQGPIVLITHIERSLCFKSIALRYLSLGKLDAAIKLLLSRNFDEESFMILQRITSKLLRRPMTQEIAQQLQLTLGCFHNSPVTLPTEIRHRFRSQVLSLTRRFFHQLIRASMYETAFLLAVDLGHHDLFMDLHYVAVIIGETEMAAAARAQASALLSRCSSEASDCSRSSCSQCSDLGSSTSDEYITTAKGDLIDEPIVEGSSQTLPLTTSNSNNFLTTDFNKRNPTTYKPPSEVIAPPIPNVDLMKFNCPPKATFVQSPKVPSDFLRMNHGVSASDIFPFAPPSFTESTLGIPHTKSNYFTHNLPPPIHSSSIISPPVFTPKPPQFLPKCYSGLGGYEVTPPKTMSLGKPIPPPLPQALPLLGNPGTTSQPAAANAKKPQAKVKFSDTITAFIVPEIKRPSRPVPPPHITDPQRELADSLPLCHPNEDYLKDFAPIRKAEDEEKTVQPKVKVVHFGVV